MSEGRNRRAAIGRRRVLGLLAGAGVGAAGGCLGGDSPELVVPESSAVDRPVDVVVENGEPGATVTLVAETEEPETGERWRAEAAFEFDDEGRVNVAEQAPVEGDYEGVDPAGLFWAKEPEHSTPTAAFFPREDYEVTFTAVEDGEAADETTTARVYPDAETEPFDDDVVGTIHLPEGTDPAPGVLLLHGSGGAPLDNIARLFADHGFVAGSLQYFGDPDPIPDDLSEVPVEYVGRAADQLRSHVRVAGDGIGLYGGSKGGELALLAGSHLDGIGAVVSVSGSGVVWEGLTAEWRRTGTSSWSLDGDPVPYVPLTWNSSVTSTGDLYAVSLDEADDETVADATIPLERADVPIFAVSGDDDGLWNAVELTKLAFERLEDAGSEHLVYDEAGHLIRPSLHPTFGTGFVSGLATGGAPAANARANRDYWPRVRSLFERALGE